MRGAKRAFIVFMYLYINFYLLVIVILYVIIHCGAVIGDAYFILSVILLINNAKLLFQKFP